MPQTAIFVTEWMLEFIQNTEFWATQGKRRGIRQAMRSFNTTINVLFLVHRKHYGQGMIDGRIEQQSLYTSGSISGSTKQFGRLFHPSYHSWCASLKDDTKYFRVDFVENRVILGIVLQGHALEHKYINRMRIEAYVDKKWETVRNTRNQQVV